MLPMDLAMRLLKGKRRFEYDILPGKQGGAVARAGLWRRPVVEPMPGMDSSMVLAWARKLVKANNDDHIAHQGWRAARAA